MNMSVSMDSTVVTNSSTHPGRTRHKWKGNITKDLNEIGWEGMAWIKLAQDRGRSYHHRNGPSGCTKCM
jgi:hypothetical protein